MVNIANELSFMLEISRGISEAGKTYEHRRDSRGVTRTVIFNV